MLFNSISFFIFFPVVTALYFIVPHKFRWLLLLLSSCVFYMAFIPYYILILLVTILIDYYAGIKIESAEGSKKKIFLIISIISTCAVLFIFKYFNFFNSNLTTIAEFFHWNYPISLVNIILPIGLSFHTFQSLSYVIEVFYGRQKAEKNFGIYSLYVMFYPQLVAGPIERPQHLLHQFYEEHYFEIIRVKEGLKKMGWGFIKKIIIADNLAIYVNQVYSNPQAYPGPVLFLATIFFAFQIYCDFSGYSDIAIGSAKVMGFKLVENFKNPYLALSVSEFWRRWHISLSSWFRDYVYIPLGGNRVKKSRWVINIIIVFLLSGLWHGANWTYAFWGLIHGMYVIFENTTAGIRQKLFHVFVKSQNIFTLFVNRLIVFISITFAWIFFRANNLNDAHYIVITIFSSLMEYIKKIGEYLLSAGSNSFPQIALSSLNWPLLELSHGLKLLIFLLLLIIFLLITDLIDSKVGLINYFNQRKSWLKWLIYYGAIMALINLSVTHEVPFIYFQF